MTTKAKLKAITFHWKEGVCGFDEPVVVTTWAAAQSRMTSWALHAPNDGSYDKLAFTVEWAGGPGELHYQGRFDLVHTSLVACPDLRAHIRDYLAFCAGVGRPAHMTEERYAAFLTGLPVHIQEAAVKLINSCSFED